MSTHYDVICIGAGMVGAAIACGLARSGFKVAVVDPVTPKPFLAESLPSIRVSAVSYASEQILRHLGAWSGIETKRLCPYRRLSVNEKHAKHGFAAKLPDISAWAKTEFDASSVNMPHLGHIVENNIVHLALHEAMQETQSIDIFCPDEVLKMNLSGKIKSLTLKQKGEVSAQLIVGADGAQSKVREVAQLGQFKEQYEQHAFVMTVRYQGHQEDITWQSFTSSGPLAFLPLSDIGEQHYASLVWYDLPEKIAQLKSLSKEDLLKQVLIEYPSDLPEIIEIEECASFPLFKSHALNYVSQGVALAGDAAHTINPLAGQGVNLGFMDAASLIEILAAAKMENQDFASLSVLNQYEKNRRKENQKMMSLMDMFYYGFSNELLPLRVMRNIGLGLANRSGVAKTKVMQYAIGATGELPKLARA